MPEHARTCRKYGKAICRFSFPVPLLPETVVLYALMISKNGQSMQKSMMMSFLQLRSCIKVIQMLFENIHAELNMDYATYILILVQNY